MSRSNNDYKNSAGGNGGDLWKSASITVKNNNQNFSFHLICTGCCLGSLLSSMILESHAVVLEEKTVGLVWRPDISAIKIGHGDSTDWHVQKVFFACSFKKEKKKKVWNNSFKFLFFCQIHKFHCKMPYYCNSTWLIE